MRGSTIVTAIVGSIVGGGNVGGFAGGGIICVIGGGITCIVGGGIVCLVGGGIVCLIGGGIVGGIVGGIAVGGGATIGPLIGAAAAVVGLKWWCCPCSSCCRCHH